MPMGKKAMPGTCELTVWNIQQNLKYTAEPGVLILPHCLQIKNYGHLYYRFSVLSAQQQPKLYVPFCYTFSCFVCWDFWFFKFLTSTITVDAAGAKRKNQFYVHFIHCWELLLTQSRRIPPSCILTAVIDKW